MGQFGIWFNVYILARVFTAVRFRKDDIFRKHFRYFTLVPLDPRLETLKSKLETKLELEPCN